MFADKWSAAPQPHQIMPPPARTKASSAGTSQQSVSLNRTPDLAVWVCKRFSEPAQGVGKPSTGHMAEWISTSSKSPPWLMPRRAFSFPAVQLTGGSVGMRMGNGANLHNNIAGPGTRKTRGGP
jgi:hypothetical protein